MVYRSVEEVPEDVQQAVLEGIVVLGRKLREWRSYGGLTSLTGRWLTADRTVVEVTCDDEDHIWVREPTTPDPVDVTSLVDAE